MPWPILSLLAVLTLVNKHINRETSLSTTLPLYYCYIPDITCH
ncbi:hypothetical protein BBOV_II000005 [Babesia bovis T2Bo]|nr:hypothetical protein BBOV_II000005 [Babesia bovis T2Bo]KAG6440159.1 hypothetical protein BBOV_II000005 [Babesia bovis T2Bo]